MRFFSSLLIAFVVCVGQGPPQKNDEADKRRAEIQKEIKELRQRFAKQLRVHFLPVEDIEGHIYELLGEKALSGFLMRASELSDTHIIQLRPDTQIMFADGTKASASDLKIGQQVSVRASQRGDLIFPTNPPMHPHEGYEVVIKRAKGIMK
jgi:hypothetical protein